MDTHNTSVGSHTVCLSGIEGVSPLPNLKILPTSPQIAVSYWSLLAQVTSDIATPRAPSATPVAAHTFLDTLMARLDAFHATQLEIIHTAGKLIADRVLGGVHTRQNKSNLTTSFCLPQSRLNSAQKRIMPRLIELKGTVKIETGQL
jgi:hypothetical protein